jgi:hypothetical protein
MRNKSMSEQNMITDVRGAKIWFDAQVPTLDELGMRLRAVEQAYRARTGEFASVPTVRPPAIQALIDRAADEPGRDLLEDLRPAS